jgi:hypothetical protein
MPGPVTFNTPLRVITYAMRNAGKLGQDSEPTPSQYAEYLNRLNDIINVEQTQGLKLWLNEDIAIASPILTAGTALYSMGPAGNVVMTKPMRIIQGYYIDSSDNKRPIDPPLSRDEYTRLSNVVQQGAISSYFVDKQQLSLNVYLWNTPDAEAATGEVHLITQIQVPNMVSLTDALSFPQEWFMWLQWALADEISTGQPQAIMDRCQQRAAIYRMALEDWDVEDTSTRFTPDSRSTQMNGSFR